MFIWTSFSEQLPLGSWLVSQGRRQTFARTFLKSSCKHSIFWYFGILGGFFQKSLGVHKILVRKTSFYPPPPRKGPKWEKTVQIIRTSSQLTLVRGGGESSFMDKTILWTSGRFWFWWAFGPLSRGGCNFTSFLLRFFRPLFQAAQWAKTCAPVKGAPWGIA